MLVASGLLAGAARADDGAARAVVEEAVRAHGGEAALAKWPVVTAKTEGIFHGHDRTPVFFFTCEATTHGADQYHAALDGDLNKQKFRVVNVLDGKRGWIKHAGEGRQDTQECTPAQLREFQEEGYVEWVTTLLPLKGEGFTLTLVGEEKVRGDPAVAVRVSSRGHRDVTLFFDKETHLLIKTETRAKAGTPVEGKVETFRGRHKAFQGVQRPTTLTVYHDGRSLISHWVLDYQVAEKPEGGKFAKP
jgi:hypothetical protein